MDQINLRNQIKEIKLNTELSEEQKQIQIQQLMNPKEIKTNKECNHNIKECNHYIKKCDKFVFEKCNNIYNCHRCHKEVCDINDCNIKNISCSECNTIQSLSNSCINCNIKFAINYCSICTIWTNKDIFHCYKCNICRAGLESDILHCDNCNMCFYNNIKHECKNIDFRNTCCPICMESIFNSQKEAIKTECNHLIHIECFKNALSNNIYQCMICKKSMIDMSVHWLELKKNIELQPLSNDLIPVNINQIVDSKYGKLKITNINNNMISGILINWQLNNNVIATFHKNDLLLEYIVKIYCNDCNLETENNFHFLGIECKNCYSFNTTLI
jgi:RING finger/CHY zinc finger protein 1